MGFRTVAGVLLLTSIAFGTWQSRAGRGDGDWQSFGRDPGARRYSPRRLVAGDWSWRLETGDWRLAAMIATPATARRFSPPG